MKCRVCGATEFKKIFQINKYTVYRCLNCGFNTLNPIPNNRVLDDMYNSNTYHLDKSMDDHTADAVKKFHFISRWIKSKSHILDYGCGVGAFLKVTQAAGHFISGYDIAETTAKNASHYSGCATLTGNLKSDLYDSNSFDAITSFDVIEHIVDFKTTLECWHKWLKPTGLLFITTPDLSSWDSKLFGKQWYGFTKIPQHVNFFDKTSLSAVLRTAGFEVLTLKTWGFSRTLLFIANLFPYRSFLKKVLFKLRIDNKLIYLPMIDVMVVARKLITI